MQEIIDRIRGHHRERNFMMEQRKRMNLALGAFMRMALGWRKDLPEDDRKAIASRAAVLVDIADAIHASERSLDAKYAKALAKFDAAKKKGKPIPAPERGIREAVDGEFDAEFLKFAPVINATILARSVFDKVEADATAEMERLAEQLPVWKAWGENVRGFGARSLAVIVAESATPDPESGTTHCIGDYATHSKLWKRMGLAVMGDVRQGGLKKSAGADEWIAHGYNAKRRAQMFMIGDCLVKQGERYREVYLARKEYERAQAEARGLIVAPSAKIPKGKDAQYISDGHIHKRAQRYMEKKLLRDLWNEWRKASVAVPEEANDLAPSAAPMLIAAE